MTLDLENPVETLFGIVNCEDVRAVVRGDENARLRALAGYRWLRSGQRVAIFNERWGGDHEAILFDIDAPSEFMWAVLSHMFDVVGARSLYLSSASGDAGKPLRAVYRGLAMFSGHSWRLDREEHEKAPEGEIGGKRKLRLAGR